MGLSMCSPLFSPTYPQILCGFLEIGYADERFLRRIAEIGHGILAGSYIQKAVIVDGKFGGR